MSRIAERITSSSPKSFGMYAKAALADQAGLIHMELGQPAHDTPPHIKAATIAAITAGHIHYSDPPGIAPLREALAHKLSSINGIAVTAGDVVVTNGLTHASFAAFFAIINPGDEVILLDPYYPQHVGKIELAGGRVVTAPLDAEHGFSIRAEWIEEKVSARTKAIVLVNPSNPTGHVCRRDELDALAGIALRHDLIVIADEVYEYNVYGGQHVSIASLPGMAARTISLYAFTKSYAMDGWRLGYATAAPDILSAMSKVTANDVTHVNTFAQYGALAAITGDPGVLKHMVDDEKVKRDFLVAALNRMPGVACPLPEGSIYAFPDIRGTGHDSQTLADRLLTEARVVVESGAFYGAGGEGYLRICFGSQSLQVIKEAVSRLDHFFRSQIR
ncbi:MAG TPA: aminotransferase class I/II-fold pyridoxal phosphate-dependent enzyme [Steroidobacteraceae bacterium]|jgi:aspartate aminotransferase|nr:aminotransferase class I/II-fold pyridoxal phosphate-dependent enzyme [Steroidobacteraceae bacterium]